VTCPCGAVFDTTEALLARGRGKYCSSLCRSRHAVRPSGLTYKITPRVNGWREKRRLPTYRSWRAMRERVRSRRGYVDRGITVCDRWLVFENFLADMGERPPDPSGWAGKVSYWSLDRINSDGNYEPSNCRWATIPEQNANRRRPRADSYPRGELKTHCIRGHPRELWRSERQCRLCTNEAQRLRRQQSRES